MGTADVILKLVVDGMLATLLVVTLYFCWKLNKRIQVLQDNRSELAETIREFDACTRRAAESIEQIHTVTQRISDNIQIKIDKANFIADDLQYMIERGNKMAGKAEAQPARESRESAAASPRPAQPTRRDREKPPVAEAAKASGGTGRPASASGIEQIAKGTVGDDTGRGPRLRSRAEQELMDVVKNTTKDPV